MVLSNLTPKACQKKKPIWMFNPQEKLRFGVYNRALKNMTGNFVWIESPFAAEIVHTLYGSNQGSKIVLWAPAGYYLEGQLDGILGGVGPLKMRMFTIDVDAKNVSLEDVEGGGDYSTEFGRVRDDRVAQTTRYGFSGLQTGNGFEFTGILKWDFKEKKRCGAILFPDGVIGGEPVFVPTASKYDGEKGDDAGYISMFLWNQHTQKSSFALFDAARFSDIPVVELEVPHKVPLGFHGWWMNKEQIIQSLNTK